MKTQPFKSLAPAIHRASTIVFDNFADFANRRERQPDGFSYGLTGTPTNRELEDAISKLHGAAHTVALPSGQAALVLVLLSLLKTGDQVIAPDNCYGPVREFLASTIRSYGIEVSFLAPGSPQAVEDLVKPSTTLILLESPGSITMEMQDVESIVRIAKKHSILTLIDNSWASPLNFQPLALGVDLVVEALSKVISGHSDLLMGSVTTNDLELYKRLRLQQDLLGMYVSPDDCYLTLRGLETYPLRLKRQSESAVAIANWLEAHPLVEKVYYPALASSEDHQLYKKLFNGPGSLFSFSLKSDERIGNFFDALRTFAIGASWGGTHSLAAYYPQQVMAGRQHNDINTSLIRLSIGLEPIKVLLEDLEKALNQTR
ncbi:hypothetical protein NS376_21395 [Pseudomonas oryzihabitans]|nr:hypothetical protein NS376_21395 [Pseudomonas psychrotolerans]